jgi:YHS domain-containing protein
VIRIVLLGILLMLAAWAFWRMVDGVIAGLGGLPERRGRGPAAMKLARDPVCGTWVARKEALSASTRGTTHYFCSEECRAKYQGRA